MMILQIDIGELWCSYCLTTHQGPQMSYNYKEHTFYSEISINSSGNIGPKITASSTMQSLTMMIVQNNYE